MQVSEYPTLKELNKLEVSGNLFLNNTQIKELPKDLKVGGGLDLSYSQIKKLPVGLKVGGGLFLNNTQIKELPHGLEVGYNLYLRNTKIYKLGKNNRIGRSIHWPVNRQEVLDWHKQYNLDIENELTSEYKSMRKLQLGF